MGNGVVIVGFLLVGLIVFAVAWRRLQRRTAAVARLGGYEPPFGERAEVADRLPADVRPFDPRWYWLPWLIAVAVALTLFLAFRPRLPYVIVPGLLVGLLGTELDRMRVERRRARIEGQLADAIDLMVGALQAGAGAAAALDAAVRESRWPLKPQLAEVVGRIRLGDDPQAVLRDLTQRVPLETFVLFATALSVHWEVGGSLAGTLATVGKAIRDRIDLGRRIRSLTAQARASVVAVLLATYFIAAIIWRNNPDRMAGFLSTQIGSWLVGFAVALQAIGVVWTTAASRIRY